jgi:hypothetical protein
MNVLHAAKSYDHLEFDYILGTQKKIFFTDLFRHIGVDRLILTHFLRNYDDHPSTVYVELSTF